MNRSVVVLGFLLSFFATSFSAGFSVKPRDLSPLMESCQECHDDDYASMVNTKSRELSMMHTDIKLNHGNGQFWCLECHDPANNNRIKRGSQNNTNFSYSVPLCSKCHGKITQEWQKGVHTKIKGGWNQPKQILQCVECHSPHSPKFGKLKPEHKPDNKRSGT
ncbi:MAG: cytochrome c3 family protein [Candidatus Margulisiibacteriota bacterium]